MLTPREHSARVAVLSALLHEMQTNPPPACCLNCDHMAPSGCRHFGEIAPEHQRTPGCPAWEEACPF